MIFRFIILFGIIAVVIWAGSLIYKSYVLKSNLEIQPLVKINDSQQEVSKKMKETIKFKTNDGVEIAGDYYNDFNNKKALLLLHMMPTTKESYEKFAQNALKNGFNSLVIDLRGHGESILQNNKILNYAKFSDSEHQKSILDVFSAVDFLKQKGFNKENIYIVGASIGANLALEYLAQNHEVKKAVLLSPGLDYRGIKTDKFIKDLVSGQGLFFIISEEDVYSFESVNKLLELTPKGVNIKEKIYQYAGHGTDIIISVKESSDLIIDWLKK